MSDLDEEGDMPDSKYFLRSGVDVATGLATMKHARKMKTKKIKRVVVVIWRVKR